MFKAKLHYQTRGGQAGFTLIELLVVIIIIGVIAAIGIPIYLSQREKAWDSVVESDLHNAAMSENTYYSDHMAYTNILNNLLDAGYEQSDEVTLNIIHANDEEYCMEAFHANNPGRVWWVDSGAGTPYPRVGNCP